jgi:hypothetical protein
MHCVEEPAGEEPRRDQRHQPVVKHLREIHLQLQAHDALDVRSKHDVGRAQKGREHQ